ncbi:MAG TPA: hypothetical protein VFU47_15090, partial [Armatimonadota bacterium]|nr:hypothetical protein [Armatimonadota bacterium]
MSSDYPLQLLRTDAELQALRPEWQQLYERTLPRNPFLGPAWNLACRAHLCAGAEPFVLTLRRGGRLAGVAPLRRERRLGFRVLRFLGDGRT